MLQIKAIDDFREKKPDSVMQPEALFFEDIKKIDALEWRVNTMIYFSEFQENNQKFENYYSKVVQVSEVLIEDQSLKKLFEIVLIVGNYLNSVIFNKTNFFIFKKRFFFSRIVPMALQLDLR